MQVPCSMPLAEPWSPVGYQVVLLPEIEVAAGKPPEVKQVPAAAAGPAHAKPSLPRSPVGYRVVLVQEDRVPTTPRPKAVKNTEPGAPVKRSGARPRPKSNGMAIWLPLVVVAAVGLPVSLATAIVAAQRGRAPAPVNALRQEGIVFQGFPAPAEQEAVAANVVVAEGGGDCVECAAADAATKPLAGREHFGTAVGFVRNPVEAARVARAERKLTFLLHVSGNFDDPGFT